MCAHDRVPVSRALDTGFPASYDSAQARDRLLYSDTHAAARMSTFNDVPGMCGSSFGATRTESGLSAYEQLPTPPLAFRPLLEADRNLSMGVSLRR